jgi:D-glycero-D-manno-heptose 1,7-bisphosphate phosphatase
LLKKCLYPEYGKMNELPGKYLTPHCHRYIFFRRSKRSHALFLDRDGVVIQDEHYINNVDSVRLLKGAKNLFNSAKEKGVPIIIITNQSGISRGITSWDSYHEITKRMLELLEFPSCLQAIYSNSESPQTNSKYWRKPNPGMICRSMQDLDIDLDNSTMIGDRRSDLKAALESGIKKLIHLKTGHGSAERSAVTKWHKQENTRCAKFQTSSLLLLDDLDIVAKMNIIEPQDSAI